MKKLGITVCLMLFLGFGIAHADPKTTDDKQVETTSPQPTKRVDSSTNLMMKIPSDDQDDQLRRKAFLEELRKLYKANFL